MADHIPEPTADGGLPGPAVPGELRASHADREAVVERLRDAAADGRIDLAELDERLERALTAKTHGELDRLTADLPTVAPPAPVKPLVLRGGMHGVRKNGRWRVPAHITAFGGLGGVKLDFTHAECPWQVVEVEANGEMAGVVLIVPVGWAVETDEMNPGLGGVRDKTVSDRTPGAPLLRLTGNGGTGGVVVRHQNRWERRRQSRSTRAAG
ncbi:DUF1707 SHOCT-like domain-containing protein [Streptomyces hoynatensis]|uniref:DUF1707 domain-containing protein n=1 Tax=Streptomyces hoynatensis TaxID=1141874 RepID=A0A3A9YR10_9ACTN|nr:DUF1707 domain-containing protein [Streptomyces hoynatensis]RKN38385.1 DUF1707 domain-containing protein [Streptomyces hoynatensis]